MSETKPTFRVLLTPEEEELFQYLHDADVGKLLSRFLAKLGDALCDSRTLSADISTAEGQVEFKGRRLAAELIQENLFRPIVQRDSKVTERRSSKAGYR